ncbi:Aste57867_21362 [Aphanomyces stellatus]|uniref:Aste57867_21362 protein n=1 Tax=Aphanomyces stellatus TaxID=120398 RepID=A0A485LHD1_9STRA|nr:hypothetical protein As57867_021293 [Aphanomyces stellatus]VFT98034.1 Aste57867_21362 [Aphanomyces stellatus]
MLALASRLCLLLLLGLVCVHAALGASIGDHYIAHTDLGVCKPIAAIQHDLATASVIRLDSMAPCVHDVVSVAHHAGVRVWLGLSRADETDFAALQQLVACKQAAVASIVDGINVIPSGHRLTTYVQRIQEFLDAHALGHVAVVITDAAVTHLARRSVSFNASNATMLGGHHKNATTTAVPILTPETPTPTTTHAPTTTSVAQIPTTTTTTVASTTTTTLAPPPLPTGPPSPSTYFGAGCPEVTVQMGDTPRTLLQATCPGFTGRCGKATGPTVWDTNHKRCPGLLSVGDFVRICCA